MSTSRLGIPLVLSALLLPLLPSPVAAQRTAEDLKRLSLEELMDVRVATVALEQVRRYGNPDILFMNVNTPADLARAQQIAAGQHA